MYRTLFIVFILGIADLSFQTINAIEEKNISPTEPKVGAPLFKRLENYHHKISTTNPLAQKYFDQGLILLYGFEYAEAIRSFKEATRLDPKCAMCHWGLALAIGSKSETLIVGGEREEAYKSIQKGLQVVDKNNASERAYAEALAKRYAAKTSSKGYGAINLTKEEMQNYADAMKKLMVDFPNDVDAKILYAAALVDVNDWKFFSEKGEVLPNGKEAISALEAAIAQSPENPAAHHFYIHIIEESPYPEKAMKSADILTTAVPGAVHLLHMPSHIYSITGRLHDATLANLASIAAYKQYQKDSLDQGFQPQVSYQYQHSLDYLSGTATKEGNKELALSAAKELIEQTPLAVAKEGKMQTYYTTIYRVQIHFKMWNEILKEPKPVAEMQFQNGIWHYARSLAFYHLDQKEKAKQEFAKLNEILANGPTKENMGEDGVKKLQEAVNELNSLFKKST